MFYPSLHGKIRKITDTVFSQLGPGLPDKVYKESFIHELDNAGIDYLEDIEIPVDYKGRILESGLSACLMIENEIVIYIKGSADRSEYYTSRIYKFMLFSGLRCGMILNFNSFRSSEIMRVFMAIEKEF
jgi:GxxExxY protein